MSKFHLAVDIDLQVDVEIEADTLEEAIEKARNGQYELPNLNDGYIGEERLSHISDGNFNLLHNFGK